MSATRVVDEIGEAVRQAFSDFIENFTQIQSSQYSDSRPTSSEAPRGDVSSQNIHDRPYLCQIMEMQATEKTTLSVDFSQFLIWNDTLAKNVQENYYRFEPYMRIAVQNIVRKYCPSYIDCASAANFGMPASQVDSISAVPGYAAMNNVGGAIGAKLRDFWIGFYNMPKVSRLRELRGEHVGKLDTISGTVTRTSEVRPELLRGAFECVECQAVISNVEQQFVYTEPIMCQNPSCQNRVAWQPLLTQCKFCDWQKVRIQEKPSEIPSGAMPRSIDVILRHEMVERAKAGDRVRFTGTVITVPDISMINTPGNKTEGSRSIEGRGRDGDGVTGLKALGVRDMTYSLAFLACHCVSESAMGFSASTGSGQTTGAAVQAVMDIDAPESRDILASFTPGEIDELRGMIANRNIYNALVRSIAPQVFGHEDIKRGILLQMLNGVHKVTPEGINLRGDLNICIVGDPSTAKSQFLKFVASFTPRSIFTSGKSSSAAGLTAAVVKDDETGEFTIEAGALMLADNGVCCIDEFDKMDIRDQVAIHEAMEQQTISIAKAGVHATLNARTSILAAANPVRGRYDKSLTLRQNIAMSAPIMSRFDLFFVVLDECNAATDVNIAQHLVDVHRYQDAQVSNCEYTSAQVQRYIKFARTFHPRLTSGAMSILKRQYKELRSDNDSKSHRVTVRQLESMIRLSEALARVHCDELITVQYAREAYRLLKKSILHIESDQTEIDLLSAPEIVVPHLPNIGISSSDIIQQSNMEIDHHTDQSMKPPSHAPRAKVLISPSELQSMAKMFVMRLRMQEDQVDEADTSLNTATDEVNKLEVKDAHAMRRSDLVAWYLEHIEDMIMTETDLPRYKRKAELVLRHLVRKSNLLMEINPKEMNGIENPSEIDDNTTSTDPLLVLNPLANNLDP